jgi:hypothetical protein
MKTLIVNSIEPACGVYQFGVNLYNILNSVQSSNKWHIANCSSGIDVLNAVNTINPNAIIFNYHPITQPFVNLDLIKQTGKVCIGIYHPITQKIADTIQPNLFHHWICSDPSLITKNQHISKFSRPIYQWVNPYPIPQVPTFGTFGFGFANKGFPKIIKEVQKQYDNAVIRMHLGFSKFIDPDGVQSKQRITESLKLIKKPGINLVASHNLLSPLELLQFLGQNTANIFLYDNMDNGISSTIDYALAVRRPIIISKSYMFRHIWGAQPSISIKEKTIPEIVANGFAPLEPYLQAWRPQNLSNELTAILERFITL